MCEHKFKHAGIYVLRRNNPSSNYSLLDLYDKYYCEKCLDERYKHSSSVPPHCYDEVEKYPRVSKNKIDAVANG